MLTIISNQDNWYDFSLRFRNGESRFLNVYFRLFLKSDDDLVMFEIIAESLKFELDKILKANESYKTDYYTCNRKKFLLTNYFNANCDIEQNAYMNEIVSLFRRVFFFHTKFFERITLTLNHLSLHEPELMFLSKNGKKRQDLPGKSIQICTLTGKS